MKHFLAPMIGLLVLLGGLPAYSQTRKSGLDIYFVDVMGGAATLIVTDKGESLLIDCGWPGQEERDAKRIEHVVKDVAKLDHLDYLMITHWHVDHFGGAEQLARRVPIHHYLDRGLPNLDAPKQDAESFPDGPKRDDPNGIAYRKLAEGKRTVLKAGDKLPLKGADIVVVAASGEVIAAPESAPINPLGASAPPDQPEDKSDNARSIAIRLGYGAFKFFDAGDLTWNVEKKLVIPTDRVGPVDVYQVTHHGLDVSNHPTLLRTLAPTVSIMNNGPRKGGTAAAVERLKGIASLKAAYQLHKNAATPADQNTDPALIANKDGRGGQFIHLSVAPGGRTYSVTIGTDGEPRNFESK